MSGFVSLFMCYKLRTWVGKMTVLHMDQHTQTHKGKHKPHPGRHKQCGVTLQSDTYNKFTFSGATNGNFRSDQRFAGWLK